MAEQYIDSVPSASSSIYPSAFMNRLWNYRNHHHKVILKTKTVSTEGGLSRKTSGRLSASHESCWESKPFICWELSSAVKRSVPKSEGYNLFLIIRIRVECLPFWWWEDTTVFLLLFSPPLSKTHGWFHISCIQMTKLGHYACMHSLLSKTDAMLPISSLRFSHRTLVEILSLTLNTTG